MKKKFFKGLKVRSISLVAMVLCCLIAVFITITSVNMQKKHESLVKMMNDYTNCSNAVIDLKKASGKLTFYTICFLENQDFDYLERYFYELNVINRRNKAVTIVSLNHKGDVTDQNTRNALMESDHLVGLELYAMALMCNALDYPKSKLPEQINNIKLQKSVMELTKQEKINYAKNIVFSESFLKARDKVTYYTEIAADSLLNIYNAEKTQCDSYLQNKFIVQVVLFSLLSVMCVSLYIILVVSVFIPLHRHLLAIQKNDKMDLRGAYEVRYIAQAYNAVADKNALDASALKHKAEHDHLTGLINREAFDEIIAVLSASKEPVAYLIVDIDFFKNVNDQYGHSVGDKVLKKIAHLLNDQFRATDYVARIGGDEFAVIMTKFGTASVMDIIRRKINGLNETLQSQANDGLPAVSLSVGVAVSDTGFKTSLIENADKALYHVKRGGRCNCYFYGAE